MCLELPPYCSYRSVRQFEAELQSVRAVLPEFCRVDDTVVVGFDAHFLGYRHAGYYLPDYLTVEYPEVNLNEGARLFVMHHQDSQLFQELPLTSSYRRLVLFPLPNGDRDDMAYFAKVKRLLPDQELQVIRVGDKELVIGSTALLPLLFPKPSTGSEHGVYPSLHSRPSDVNSREHRLNPRTAEESPLVP